MASDAGLHPVDSDVLHALNEQWLSVAARLRGEVGEAAYRSWLKPLAVVGESDAGLCLSVPTRFMRDWIVANYLERVKEIWAEQAGFPVQVEIVVQPASRPQQKPAQPVAIVPEVSESPSESLIADEAEETPAVANDSVERTPSASSESPTVIEFAAEADIPDAVSSLQASLDPRFTFDNFVVGKPNELAYAAARRVAEAEAVPFNPLFLYGGVGLGKTHLMHAIAWQIQAVHPQKKVIYLSAEKFMYQFVRALRTKDTMSFKEQFRSVDVLMIDDVQFIGGREATQEEFFHTFNALVDQNRQVIISADKSPSDLEGMEERMKSRMGWGLVADIHPTTYELRLGILESKAEQMDVRIPQKVIEFLAHKITSNIRELEGALNRIVAHATLVGRPVTIETTQEVLQDLLRANDRRVTIEEIQKRVAEHFNIKVADMHSSRRARAVARPRQIAMFLSKQLTSRSLPDIGRKFGGRDHTTVMHAVRKIEELVETDLEFSEDVELLRRMLES
ncbi:chromosomal replication initiator protein DnaA [Kiloniella sp. b19]|uniref:chromosomal replication initiator protein DnaA n=1 Tax=Kiloniella sp. GXU_MW_B19 TaxID=3141326 RepID=UPI0031D34591